MKFNKIVAITALAFAALGTIASADEQTPAQTQVAAAQTAVAVANQLPAKATTIADIQPQKRIVPGCTAIGPLPSFAAGSKEAAPLDQWLIDWEAVGNVCRAKLF